MSDDSQDRLLSIIDSIYGVALSPSQYEAFANAFDEYVRQEADTGASSGSLDDHIDKALLILERLHILQKTDSDDQMRVDRETAPAAIIRQSGDVLAANQLWSRYFPNAGASIWDYPAEQSDMDKLRASLRSFHEVSEDRTLFVRIVGRGETRQSTLAIQRVGRDLVAESEPKYLICSDEATWSKDIERLIENEFLLTQAEVSLLEQMVQGESFADIAQERSRGLETIKSQSKSIYRKMQVAGREEAVRLTLRLHLLLKGGEYRPERRISEPNFGKVVLPTGQKIAWRKIGASNGDPVVFLHGMGLGHGVTDQFEKALIKQKITAICIDRPGYGQSDPPKNWRNSVAEWAECFPHLLDGLGLDRIAILTHTSGVLFGCAAARLHPEKVLCVCALAGGVPITDDAMLADYPAQTRLISRAGRFSSKALRFVLSTSAAFYRSEAGRNRLLKRTYGSVPCDSEALNSPEILQLVHDGMEMISSGGFDGFVGDGLKIFTDWSCEVSGMTVPLHYIIGEEDPICPLNWARAFAQRFNHVDVTSIPNAGQLLHHTFPERIVPLIREFLDQPVRKLSSTPHMRA